MEKQLQEQLAKLSAMQDMYKGRPMPEKVANEWNEAVLEAKQLQDRVDQEAELRDMERKAKQRREIADPILPKPDRPDPDPEVKADEVIGYMRWSDAAIMSPEFSRVIANPESKSLSQARFTARGAVHARDQIFVPITKEMKARMDAARDEFGIKAVPTLGAGIIEPQRLADMVVDDLNDPTILRNNIVLGSTNSNQVEWAGRVSFTRAAAPVADAGTKPEAASNYTMRTADVRTIAVWQPATVQQLADWPALQSLMDTDLRYDLRKVEEEQMTYGDGLGQNFEGLFVNASITDIQALTRYTGTEPFDGQELIEAVRVGMTEVRLQGYMPDRLLIHPLDWETIALAQGTDNHFLAQVFPTAEGQFRLWGLNVVESHACEENAGNTIEERNLLVYDSRMLATLWIREAISVQLGMVNDDFITNVRTLLAEFRAAFGVRRPLAGAKLLTDTAVV